MNISGQRVSDSLEQLEQDLAREELRVLRDAQAEDFLAQGQRIRAGLQMITHAEMHPRDFDVPGMRAWLQTAWSLEEQLKVAHEAVAEGKDPRSALGQMEMGRWIADSGMSVDDAARELSRRIDAGEPMPWDAP